MVPVALFCRQLFIFGAGLYFLFHLASLGLELFKFLHLRIPPAIVTKAQQIRGIQQLKLLLMDVPKWSDKPDIVIQPELAVLENLFQTNPVIALDTEFQEEGAGELAYIQINFLKSNTICVLTYKAKFSGFCETFFKWLSGNVAIVGFFMTVDLMKLWRHFNGIAPKTETLLFKVFDLYLFLKFVHNGFKDRNGLKYWSKRLLHFKLDKTYQKCDWFQTKLTPEIQKYITNDVLVLHGLLNYVQTISHLYYYNTWTSQKHTYFETSYQLDQTLIPLFLDMSLQGISVSTNDLEIESHKNKQLEEGVLSKLGITLEIYHSKNKFTDFIKSTMHPISSLVSIWPTTPTGFLQRSKKDIAAWVTRHTADSRFKNDTILDWITDYLGLAENESRRKFFNSFKDHTENNKVNPLWDLFGADTGRITTSKPGIHSTPRHSTARKIIVPSKPENTFVIFDYKTIELVILAILAKDPTMLHVFNSGLV